MKKTPRTTSMFILMSSTLIIILVNDTINKKENSICKWDKEFKEASACKYVKPDDSNTYLYYLMGLYFFVCIVSIYKIYSFSSQDLFSNGPKGVLGKIKQNTVS